MEMGHPKPSDPPLAPLTHPHVRLFALFRAAPNPKPFGTGKFCPQFQYLITMKSSLNNAGPNCLDPVVAALSSRPGAVDLKQCAT